MTTKTKTAVALKPKLVTTEEIKSLMKKFGSFRTTVSTYTTHWGNVCTLYTYWYKGEKAGQLHDYGYNRCFKDFVHMVYYTDNENWVDG